MLTTQSGLTSKQELNTLMPITGTTGSPKGASEGLLMSFQRKTANNSGDGVTIVPNGTESGLGRVTGLFSTMRKLSTKAGRINSTRRGSGGAEVVIQNSEFISIKAVSNIHNLVSAYETIKSKPGNMTPGTDKETLDGINLNYFKKLQKDLLAGVFKFSPARRVLIPKPGNPDKKRPLNIASPREKIVQQAMVNVLTPVYEPTFLDTSHGFRPEKSTHTAILDVEAKFNSVKYIVEADFAKAFDSIQHRKLMEIVRKTIKDEKLISLLWSSLKAGFIDEVGTLHKNSLEGTPQGSVLSPILCNIFLHELDLFMEGIIAKYNKGINRPRNKTHMNLTNKIRHMRKKGQNISEKRDYIQRLKTLLQTPSKAHDERYIRIHYIRYADDFIIGVEGGRKLADQILKEVTEFIEGLGLKFNPEKTRVVDFNKETCSFLGYTLRGPYKKGSSRGLEVYKEPNSLRLALRRKKERMSVYMDMKKIISKLEANGFIRKRLKPGTRDTYMYRGKYVGSLINLDHADILRRYSSVIRGIYNYFQFCNNTRNLSRIIWLLTESCGLTLARKLNLKTFRAVLSRFGKNLGTKILDNKGNEHVVTL